MQAAERWTRKAAFLQERGELVSIRGCEWKQKLKSGIKQYSPRSFPLINNYSGNEDDIISGIADGSLFGYIECDIMTPPKVVEHLKWINFPPLIVRDTIEEDMLSEYMGQRVKGLI